MDLFKLLSIENIYFKVKVTLMNVEFIPPEYAALLGLRLDCQRDEGWRLAASRR